MATVTDDFSRADSNDLGTNWDPVTAESHSGLAIFSGRCIPQSGFEPNDASETWNANSFGADQYAQVIFFSTGANGVGSGMGVLCRATGGATLTHYRFIGNASGYELARFNAGAFTSLASGSGTTFAATDTMRLEVSGTGATVTLKMFKNGVQFGGNISDSSASRITSAGKVGIAYSSNDGSAQVADWGAGDLNASTGTSRRTIVFMVS